MNIKYASLLFVVLCSCADPSFRHLSEQHLLTVMENTVTNLGNGKDEQVKAIATVYNKEVMEALGEHYANVKNYDDSLRNYYKNAFILENEGKEGDTLNILLTLINTQYPCGQSVKTSSVIGVQPMLDLSTLPCKEVDITEIYKKVYLKADALEIHPFGFSGCKKSKLTDDEYIFLRFVVGTGSWKMQNNVKSIELIIALGEQMIALPLRQ